MVRVSLEINGSKLKKVRKNICMEVKSLAKEFFKGMFGGTPGCST